MIESVVIIQYNSMNSSIFNLPSKFQQSFDQRQSLCHLLSTKKHAFRVKDLHSSSIEIPLELWQSSKNAELRHVLHVCHGH